MQFMNMKMVRYIQYLQIHNRIVGCINMKVLLATSVSNNSIMPDWLAVIVGVISLFCLIYAYWTLYKRAFDDDNAIYTYTSIENKEKDR